MRSKYREFFERRVKHMERGSYHEFEFWIAERAVEDPTFTDGLGEELWRMISAEPDDEPMFHAAVLALAVSGKVEDATRLREEATRRSETAASDMRAAALHIENRFKSIWELLRDVHDQWSFRVFVEALAEERRRGEAIERENPERYRWAAAFDWQNTSIPTFLEAAISEIGDEVMEPTWQNFAELLYAGKIIE